MSYIIVFILLNKYEWNKADSANNSIAEIIIKHSSNGNNSGKAIHTQKEPLPNKANPGVYWNAETRKRM